MKRSSAALTTDSLDCLGAAINGARKFSERIYDFELNRVPAKVTVDFAAGAAITSVTDMNGTALSVKTIKQAFVPYGANAMPVRFISRDAYVERIARTFKDSYNPTQVDPDSNLPVSEITLVRFGSTLFLSPNTPDSYGTPGATNIIVYLDVIKFLPDYTLDADTDFFLDQCYDYLAFRTLETLNAFLKEDQRIPVSTKLMAAAWKSVVEWDQNLVQLSSTNVATLD